MKHSAPMTGAERLRRAERWWMLAVLLTLYVLSQLDRMIITMLVDPIQKDLGLTDLGMSLILGPAFGVCYALFGLPLGWAADRYPRRAVISVGVGLWSLATAACGLTASFWQLFVSRVGVGVGEAALSPAAYSLIADKFPPQRLATALAVYGTGPKLGKAVGYALGAMAIGLATDIGEFSIPGFGPIHAWQIAFFLVGAPGLAVLLLVWTFSEPARGAMARPRRQADANLWGFMAKNRVLMATLLLGFGSVTVISGAVEWAPTYIGRRFGHSATEYGPVLSLVSVVAAGSVLAKGAAIDWLYARGLKDAHLRFYSWLLFPAILITAFGYFSPTPMMFFVCYGAIQTVALGHTLYMSSIIQLIAPPQVRAQLSAVFLFVVTLGVSLGPLAVGALTDLVFRDPAKLGWSLAVVCTTGVVIAFVAMRLALPLIHPLLAESGVPRPAPHAR